ncbi:MAG: hypothetical protein HC806_08625 [Anaerolineae bacterium]|nr:hypothetical protein [Anaerolineae bacterium]
MLSKFVVIPSSIIEWGFLGAFIFILQDMMRRFIDRDLTPRFYFLSFIRIILALAASVLLFSVIQAGPASIYEISNYKYSSTDGTTFSVNPKDGINAVYWLLPICFTAGFFPIRTISFVTKAVFNWLSEKKYGQFLKVNSQSISLQYVNGIDARIETRLSEEGISSSQILANNDLAHITGKTPFSTTTLLDWQDQAILFCNLGKNNLEVQKGADKAIFELLVEMALDGIVTYIIYIKWMQKANLTKIYPRF